MAFMPWNEVSARDQRYRLALEMVRRRHSVAEITRRFGVCRATAYKWSQRFEAEGKMGLDLRQVGRPVQSGGHAATWLKRLLALRRRKVSWGAGKLRWWMEQLYGSKGLPAARTLHRWLVRQGRVRPRKRALRAGDGLSHAVLADAPNAVWSVDFKGDICTGDAGRVIPLTVRDLYSRFMLAVTPMAQLSEAAVRAVFERLFRRHGVPRAIRVDRGAPFCGAGPYGLTTLSLWWTRLGIEVQFVSRRHRIDNNAHEQMHRILKDEAATPPSRTYEAQVRRLQRWRHQYNHRRPHDSLEQHTPAELYRPSVRRRSRLIVPHYPADWVTRRVRPHGWIKLAGSHRHIGRAFVGSVIGFRPHEQLYVVYFGSLVLGTLDPSKPRTGLLPIQNSNRGREGADAPSLRPSPSFKPQKPNR